MNKPLSPFAKVVFWFVAANALIGAASLIVFPSRTWALFFWEIKPPLSAALFGALYLGGALVVGWVTYRGFWEPARFLIPVLVSAGVFISIATLLHLESFAPGLKLGYWLVIYIGAPLLALVIYLQHERAGANWAVTEPVTPATRTIAIVAGALLVLSGIIVLGSPNFVVAQWPWPTSPLMVRIFASWFSAFGVGLLWFVFERDWRRLHLLATMMIAAAGFDLVMVFVHRDDLTAGGVNLWVYCSHLALFGVVGLLMHGLQRRVRPQRSAKTLYPLAERR
ncbi:MAG: hypothetical protein ACFB50_08855 [Rubrobacteraceae bacterium]